MVRFLLRVVIDVVDAALALLVASWLLSKFTIEASGFFIAVAVFVVAQAILTPAVLNLVRKHASALIGGIGLISALLALWIASLFDGGLSIQGVSTWVLASLIVWLVTAIAGWILRYLILTRWWERRGDRTSARG